MSDPPIPSDSQAATGFSTPNPSSPDELDPTVVSPASLATSKTRWRLRLSLLLVLAPIVFNLISLRGEVNFAQPLNDEGVHLQMVDWAKGQIDEGRIPVDGWFPNLQLGSPHFHHYQSLSHLVTAYVSELFGVRRTLVWTLYVLLALWPLSVYWGARLLGWGRLAAGSAALVSPFVASLPGHGFEHGSYIWSGYGIWSQLWAMWAIPLAWGLSYRAIARNKSIALAALAVGMTATLHFLTGYQAFTALAAWLLVSRTGLVRRLRRTIVVAGGAGLIASWVLVPLLVDSRWAAQTVFNKGTFFSDSFGARKIIGWFVGGRLFDSGRPAVLTALVFAGMIVCVLRARTDERARALLTLTMISFALFFGRPTFGSLLRALPGSGDLLLHRFISGVHLCGILLAGVGLAAVVRVVTSLVARLNFAALPFPKLTANPGPILLGVAVLLGLAILYPAAHNTWETDASSRDSIQTQQFADETDGADAISLIDRVRLAGDGRVYAGRRGNWGSTYKIGDVPVFNYLTNENVDSIGFTLRTAALSADIEPYFDDTSRGWFDLLNIRYLLLPADRPPSVDATLIASAGRHRLWKVQTTGYLKVVDTIAPLAADRATIRDAMVPYLNSAEFANGLYPTVAFAGTAAGTPTDPGGIVYPTPPGTVDNQTAAPADGIFSGTVNLKRPAVVMLKSSFDRRWTAAVDGRQVQPQMIAPSFVGVPVPAGTHFVSFAYEPFDSYLLLFTLGVLTLLGLAAAPRVRVPSIGLPDRPAPPAKTAPAASMEPRRGDVLVVVPAYNEQDAIGGTLADLHRHCPWADVVVISDGSMDDTAQRAVTAGAHVLALPINLGIGGAVQTGFIYGAIRGYRVVVQVDGDGQHRAQDVLRLTRPVLDGEADVVIGSRFKLEGPAHNSRWRGLGIRLLAKLISGIVRQPITDPTSGFRAYSAPAAEYVSREYPYDYPEPEALVALRRKGFSLLEIPVEMRERAGGVSSIGRFVAVRYMTKVVLAIVISILRPEGRHSARESAFLRR